MEIRLGKLEKIELRNIWNSEATHFTPWLAKLENLKLLGETIGLELELEAQEKDVGPFRADILCKEVSTNSWVLIENQLEKTDHTHLGQLLTYASGLKAVNIVWIAERFTEEHRAALDWLNEITDSQFNFFGLEVELWKIGNSEPAPKFNIISKPNDWSKTVNQSAHKASDQNLTESKSLQLLFWNGFNEYAKNHSRIIRPTKALPQHWMFMAIGRTGFKLCAIASVYSNEEVSYSSHEIRAEFILDGENAKSQYNKLFGYKEEIESEMGENLIWHNPENANMCRIGVRKTTRIDDPSIATQNYEWVLKKLEKIKGVFGKRIEIL